MDLGPNNYAQSKRFEPHLPACELYWRLHSERPGSNHLGLVDDHH
jgi:hypothetical protein